MEQRQPPEDGRAKDQPAPQRAGDDVPGQLAKGAEEAGEALAKEFAKGIAKPEPAGDPEVTSAFALGWQMSELYRPDRWHEHEAKPEDDLPGLGRLGGRERAALGLGQLSVGLKSLEKTIKDSNLEMPTVTAAKAAIPAKVPDAPYEKALFDLHVELLTTLTAAHFKLGKAYGLGRALADTTRIPRDLDTLKLKLNPHRIANLTNWLADLTSLFPPHAAHVVHDSLEMWRDWATNATAGLDPKNKAVALLRRQGERWRSMLSGEKSATDALKPEDYVRAGQTALSQTSTLALSFLGRFKAGVAVALILFIGGLALVIFEPTSGSLAGGLAGILGSLGLTWKGVGASLGATAAKMERPIWGGALDAEIAQSISLIPGTAAAANYVAPEPPPAPAPAEPGA